MITTGQFTAASEPISRLNFDAGFEKPPLEKDMFYTVRKSNKLTETYLEMGDIAPMGQFSGTLNYADISQGYQFTSTATEFAQGIKIQRRFIETDQLDIVNGLPEKLGVSAHRRIATDVFFPFNNAFNTSITTLDGLALCSGAHTSNNGGTNQINRGTSAFGPVAVEATRINMKNFLTNTDARIPGMNPDMLIVPESLLEPAMELISSTGKVDTANNNSNFHKGRYKVVNSIWLDDTNNWFMVDSKIMKKYLDWRDIVELEFNKDKDFDHYTKRYSAYMFYDRVPRDWRWCFGHEVS